MTVGKILGFGAAIVATLTVVTFICLSPPWENRPRVLDAQRRSQLSSVEGAINMHYRVHQKLPATLEELQKSAKNFGRTILLDPGTGQPFEYEVVNERDYRLCVTFERSTDDDLSLTYARQHKAGRNCFENKILAIKS